MKQVFIDGSAGTTGLRIQERLAGRTDLDVRTLPEALRKDPDARREALNAADAAILCLPDEAARESVSLITNPNTVVLDASTAHRTAPGWAYGFPELSPEFERRVRTGRRIAVPGCHASGFIALTEPLTAAGLLPRSARLSCYSLTGYSGGGRKMIAQYESSPRSPLLDSPRIYALGQHHKHLPEMQAYSGLDSAPVFLPVVGDFYSGMLVTVPLTAADLAPGRSLEDVRLAYRQAYQGPVVRYVEAPDEAGFMAASALSGFDSMQVSVFGCEERFVLAARYDNLGKGASGAAIECLNLVLGEDPVRGLRLAD
ncbi:N-acetyl-gamma-glutamyl-phosphate reductase [Mesosutterella sp. AGMB02718]|uniref:N-acetyl-gamma-glutamyl-phosphate reductase n=1 Tax=Mesosutterella faecium TaxID=2925194 RepID=A0ABT7IN75_9BURK|nr:N-acetyl-gamma-glutamyl-phosphate reductase [Mesosutterella sp. AGMB02718]MDL2059825.1 N-acetyl-gamma-glutamyl-phosphate reductase [Mesosutterella sp. AGMB02718]